MSSQNIIDKGYILVVKASNIEKCGLKYLKNPSEVLLVVILFIILHIKLKFDFTMAKLRIVHPLGVGSTTLKTVMFF